MVTYIVIGVLVVLAVLVLFTYNNLVQLRNKVKEAFSTMDVYLKKRYDLIPSLVEVVKGYAKHETDTLQEVTQMRVNAQKGDLDRRCAQVYLLGRGEISRPESEHQLPRFAGTPFQDGGGDRFLSSLL